MSDTVKIFTRRAGETGFMARSGEGPWVLMDTGAKKGAMSPFEVLFAALAGCSAYDVVHVLQKKRIAFDDLWIEVEAERRDEHPRIATKIHVHYTVFGENIPPEAVERAIALSAEKYCSVSGMLSQAAAIETSFEIRPPVVAE